jgi:hypothetical protein
VTAGHDRDSNEGYWSTENGRQYGGAVLNKVTSAEIAYEEALFSILQQSVTASVNKYLQRILFRRILGNLVNIYKTLVSTLSR